MALGEYHLTDCKYEICTTYNGTFLEYFVTDCDLLLTGFDLKKDPYVILAAYNDSKGVTREFNLNPMSREKQ
jgi:uncharacterized SAM-dependent methyltransferase